MSDDNLILTITLKKEGNKLVMPDALSEERYKVFLGYLNEGDNVEALFELKSKDATKAQIKKIHTCLKIMADEQGTSADDMKKQLKDEAGMSYIEDGVKVYQSFTDCSKKELSNVIETMIQMARFMNINLEEM